MSQLLQYIYIYNAIEHIPRCISIRPALRTAIILRSLVGKTIGFDQRQQHHHHSSQKIYDQANTVYVQQAKKTMQLIFFIHYITRSSYRYIYKHLKY